MRHASLLVGLVALGIPGLGLGATDEGARLPLPPSEWMAKGEAAVLAVPNFINYATSASFGRLGLQAWANWQPLGSVWAGDSSREVQSTGRFIFTVAASTMRRFGFPTTRSGSRPVEALISASMAPTAGTRNFSIHCGRFGLRRIA